MAVGLQLEVVATTRRIKKRHFGAIEERDRLATEAGKRWKPAHRQEVPQNYESAALTD